MKYAIRIPANKDLERDIAETPPVGRPGHKPVGTAKAAILANTSPNTAVDEGSERSEIRRPRGEGRRGRVGMQCKQRQFPGFGFSGSARNAPRGGEDSAQRENPQLGGST